MHQASRVQEVPPLASPEGGGGGGTGDHPYPDVTDPQKRKTAVAIPKARERSGHPQKRAGTHWGASN